MTRAIWMSFRTPKLAAATAICWGREGRKGAAPFAHLEYPVAHISEHHSRQRYR